MPHASIPQRACATPERRRRAGRTTAVGITLAALLMVPGGVAGRAAADWPAEQFNPRPLPDDVVLPMPCGGAMAFRRVDIPASGPLDDRLVRIGGTDEERGYLEGARPAYVAGSFGGGPGQRYYLIGKYEVSRLQYQAIGGNCPPPAADLRLPQNEVGWVDAVIAADHYSLWLRANAAAKLPTEDKEPGFVRLPTEVEWEFAARGGIAVSESEFAERVFPMPAAMAGHVWFGGSASANGKIQRIGLLQPNPLGIHDILGNVDEIVFDPFRLNRLDRLHGQVGGFIVRGGNFTTSEEDVRTAYRQEIPFYQGKEPRRSTTTGFRLAVTSRVVTSRERLQALEAAWAELGSDRPPAAEAPVKAPQMSDKPLDDPIQELGAIAEAAGDPNMQKRLKNLQLAFRASFQARDEQRDRAAKARLRLGTFLCQKLKDDGGPIDRLKKVYDACVETRGAQHERCVSQKTTIDEEEGKQWENLRYYADTIVTLVEDYGDPVLEKQLAVLKEELGARGLQGLSPVADTYRRHVRQFRKDQAIQRNGWLNDCKAL